MVSMLTPASRAALAIVSAGMSEPFRSLMWGPYYDPESRATIVRSASNHPTAWVLGILPCQRPSLRCVPDGERSDNQVHLDGAATTTYRRSRYRFLGGYRFEECRYPTND